MKPELIIVTPSVIPPDYMARFNEHFNVHLCATAELQQQALKSDWVKKVRAVFTSGSVGIKPDLLKAMPNVEIVCCKVTMPWTWMKCAGWACSSPTAPAPTRLPSPIMPWA